MTAKHTPGPWKTAVEGNGRIFVDSPSISVARVSNGRDGEANARLIAAAPDLLAACERIDSKITNGGTQNAYPVAPSLTWDDVTALRAAIAKARGEA